MDGDTEAHAARGRALRPPARRAAAAPGTRPALLQGAEPEWGSPSQQESMRRQGEYCRISSTKLWALQQRRFNCSGRNLCFNIFLFVCLKQVPTSLRKPCPTFPRKHGCGFFLPSFALHISSFLFFVFHSFFSLCVFLSFLSLSLSLVHVLF